MDTEGGCTRPKVVHDRSVRKHGTASEPTVSTVQPMQEGSYQMSLNDHFTSVALLTGL